MLATSLGAAISLERGISIVSSVPLPAPSKAQGVALERSVVKQPYSERGTHRCPRCSFVNPLPSVCWPSYLLLQPYHQLTSVSCIRASARRRAKNGPLPWVTTGLSPCATIMILPQEESSINRIATDLPENLRLWLVQYGAMKVKSVQSKKPSMFHAATWCEAS